MDLIGMKWALSDLVGRKASISAEISVLETSLWNFGGSDLSWTLQDAKEDLRQTELLLAADTPIRHSCTNYKETSAKANESNEKLTKTSEPRRGQRKSFRG